MLRHDVERNDGGVVPLSFYVVQRQPFSFLPPFMGEVGPTSLLVGVEGGLPVRPVRDMRA